MARHPNQRSITVNPARENQRPQARPAPAPRPQVLDDLNDSGDTGPGNAPQRLGVNFHLLLTGQSRAGGLF